MLVQPDWDALVPEKPHPRPLSKREGSQTTLVQNRQAPPLRGRGGWGVRFRAARIASTARSRANLCSTMGAGYPAVPSSGTQLFTYFSSGSTCSSWFWGLYTRNQGAATAPVPAIHCQLPT